MRKSRLHILFLILVFVIGLFFILDPLRIFATKDMVLLRETLKEVETKLQLGDEISRIESDEGCRPNVFTAGESCRREIQVQYKSSYLERELDQSLKEIGWSTDRSNPSMRKDIILLLHYRKLVGDKLVCLGVFDSTRENNEPNILKIIIASDESDECG